MPLFWGTCRFSLLYWRDFGVFGHLFVGLWVFGLLAHALLLYYWQENSMWGKNLQKMIMIKWGLGHHIHVMTRNIHQLYSPYIFLGLSKYIKIGWVKMWILMCRSRCLGELHVIVRGNGGNEFIEPVRDTWNYSSFMSSSTFGMVCFDAWVILAFNISELLVQNIIWFKLCMMEFPTTSYYIGKACFSAWHI